MRIERKKHQPLSNKLYDKKLAEQQVIINSIGKHKSKLAEKKALKQLAIHYNLNDSPRARRKLKKYLRARRKDELGKSLR